MLDGCLYDDDLPIANLEPGVSGRNSLPLPGTPGPGNLRKYSFLAPLGVTLDAFCSHFRPINSRIDFINDFSLIELILKVFDVYSACSSSTRSPWAGRLARLPLPRLVWAFRCWFETNAVRLDLRARAAVALSY